MKKWNLFFRLFLSRLQPYLFLPRPNYYFFSVFCPEMFQNLLFSGRNQLFLVFPREGRTFFSSRRLGFVVPREGTNPSGLFELTRRPSGQKLSLVTTRVGPGDNKDSYPPLGQQFPTFGTKKFLPSLGKTKKSLFLPEKKKILKHFWAENTGKIVIWPRQEKIRLQPWRKIWNNECNFFVLYGQFLLLFYKKSWWIQFYINFYVFLWKAIFFLQVLLLYVLL